MCDVFNWVIGTIFGTLFPHTAVVHIMNFKFSALLQLPVDSYSRRSPTNIVTKNDLVVKFFYSTWILYFSRSYFDLSPYYYFLCTNYFNLLVRIICTCKYIPIGTTTYDILGSEYIVLRLYFRQPVCNNLPRSQIYHNS